MYKLGKLSIENFKSIEHLVEIDLKNIRAAVFDGPNGFGKTTIFDAIEICFIGRVSRINSAKMSNDNKAREGHLLKNKHSKPTSIKLELVDDEEGQCLVIYAIIKSDIKGRDASVKNYKEHIERYYATEWNAKQWSVLDETTLTSKLELTKLSSLFSVQHYISQEETTHFLKDRSESDRHDQLSHLFGTVVQVDELNAMEAIKSRLVGKRDDYKYKGEEKSKLLETMQATKPDEENGETGAPSGEINFIVDLAKKEKQLPVLDASLSALESILPAIKYPDVYKNERFNAWLDLFETSREQELDDLIKFGTLNEFKEIEKLHRAKRKFDENTEKLKRYREIREKIESDANDISEILLSYLQQHFQPSEKVIAEIQQLSSLRRQGSTFTRLRTQLLTHRNSLLEAYKKFHDQNHLDEVVCPLCGDEKENGIDQLINEYDHQERIYEDQSSIVDREIFACTSYLLEYYVEKIWRRVEHYISKASWIEEAEVTKFFLEKNIDENRFNKMIKLRGWLDDQGVAWRELADNSLFTLSLEYSGKKSNLKSAVKKLRKSIYQIEAEIDLDLIRQGQIILDIKSDEILSGITMQGIVNDIAYLRSEMVKIYSSEAQKLRGEITLINQKIDGLNQKITSIDAVIKIYNESIKKYEIDVASSIAIPFYIYSSKVLQTRLDGTGIFLKTPSDGGREKNPYIRFCARKSDTHDAWCTMSSGQLAGLVISFALAMNKLYPSKLQTVLIDDPVQSMDEINMASLVQLFIYEFPMYQFIVSTHEQKIASYMGYKFIQGGGKVGRFNMREIVSAQLKIVND
ncbi:AAA family ATPase [Aquitalea aquatilis]|uniref:AAA family ATPase n=1 Tax=Aquitalea aquatilis TaxID=1537400 RepID=UPI0010BD316E|nr:AAA family ATPase [Aquitalea aquatilis]